MVKLELIEHNFNEVFAQIFMKHAETLISRLWTGGEAGYDQGSNFDINEGKVGFKKNMGALEADMARISVATREELQHDVRYLQQ